MKRTLQAITGVVVALVIGVATAQADQPQAHAGQDIDIFNAARAGDISAIQAYAAAGGDLEVTNHMGHTPFILATYYGHNGAAEALIALGVDYCAVDVQGSNALMGVVFKGHLSTAEWLIGNASCGVDHRNYAGQTALMMAALFERLDIMELLLDHGADPAARDARGNTAESLAQMQGLDNVLGILSAAAQD